MRTHNYLNLVYDCYTLQKCRFIKCNNITRHVSTCKVLPRHVKSCLQTYQCRSFTTNRRLLRQHSFNSNNSNNSNNVATITTSTNTTTSTNNEYISTHQPIYVLDLSRLHVDIPTMLYIEEILFRSSSYNWLVFNQLPTDISCIVMGMYYCLLLNVHILPTNTTVYMT